MVRVALITFAVAFVAVTHVTAGQMEDVVYLENGGIVRGTILEQIPDESLKIRRGDGKELSIGCAILCEFQESPSLNREPLSRRKTRW